MGSWGVGVGGERERGGVYSKFQACLGLETFTANFRPSWGFFKACPVSLTDSYKIYTIVYIYYGLQLGLHIYNSIYI